MIENSAVRRRSNHRAAAAPGCCTAHGQTGLYRTEKYDSKDWNILDQVLKYTIARTEIYNTTIARTEIYNSKDWNIQEQGLKYTRARTEIYKNKD